MSEVDNKFIVMPEYEDMMERLISVMSDPHAIERLYPDICRMAGKELYALGIVLGLTLAIHDYAEGMPPIVENIVLRYVPKYLEALIDDEDVRRISVDHFNAAMSAAGH